MVRVGAAALGPPHEQKRLVRTRAQPVTPLTPPRTQFRFWRLPRPMADVKNFDFMLGLADLIVDKKRAVQKFADQGPFSNHSAHAGKASQ